MEIAENELIELNNRKEVAVKEGVAEISIMREDKEKEKKGLKNKIRKLKKEIEKNDLSELIIDRTKGNGGISNRMDISANESQELEEKRKLRLEKKNSLRATWRVEIHFRQGNGNSKKRGTTQNEKKRKGCSVGCRNGS